MPTLPAKALLVKLFYRNSENAEIPVREFSRLKKQRHGPMSTRALKYMVVKFEKTRQLGVLSRRGRKRENTAVVEDIATEIVEANTESLQEIVSVPIISRTLDMPYSPVRHIMYNIFNFNPYKIYAFSNWKSYDPDTRKSYF
ncbi:DUF4817 domain-containing protein [Trichonephila clavipes]|nr:DUF4817 domain-containing protein [Trichonephila clavipes]